MDFIGGDAIVFGDVTAYGMTTHDDGISVLDGGVRKGIEVKKSASREFLRIF